MAASMPKAVYVPFYKIHKIIRMLCICGGGAPSFSPLFANCAKKVITSFCFLCVVCRYILYSIPASLHDVFALAQTLQKGPFCA